MHGPTHARADLTAGQGARPAADKTGPPSSHRRLECRRACCRVAQPPVVVSTPSPLRPTLDCPVAPSPLCPRRTRALVLRRPPGTPLAGGAHELRAVHGAQQRRACERWEGRRLAARRTRSAGAHADTANGEERHWMGVAQGLESLRKKYMQAARAQDELRRNGPIGAPPARARNCPARDDLACRQPPASLPGGGTTRPSAPEPPKGNRIRLQCVRVVHQAPQRGVPTGLGSGRPKAPCSIHPLGRGAIRRSRLLGHHGDGDVTAGLLLGGCAAYAQVARHYRRLEVCLRLRAA